MKAVRVVGLSKTFTVGRRKVEALKGIDLEVEEGEFFVFLGSSGSGKSTLIRCIAGLEEPDAGEIWLGEELIFSKSGNIFLDPADRSVGMVFQSYAIWPHLTVLDNVVVPLITGRKRLPKNQAIVKAKQTLQMVDMEALAERPASLLSGGQQQRVAVARALAADPKILLMDEPLSNLDARLREQVRHEIGQLAKQTGKTVLYVTHDQVEAMAVASRIATLSDGLIMQVSDPAQLYAAPANVKVAQFMGSMNWLDGQASEKDVVHTAVGKLTIVNRNGHANGHALENILLGIRPEHLRVATVPSGEENEFMGVVHARTFLGDQTWYEISVGNKNLLWKTMESSIVKGKVFVRFPKDKLHVFPAREK